ncbi:hypothetical protein GCK72_014434 [Caenorhabditis remanei]|uniref:Uncharacterized protein n=1 Tax=Caenorhabditis remanei TaxID=31234 RepID=A0A6A5GTQ1_CAERE|nr:hypothetical protein GCK72_014434 [Caenorhabditis remanei]KAF1757976.1 hypothetical protein GCK72_014434 [Caenorhabditis remanei]
MTKVIETGCQVRIQEHFNDSLEFQYLNTLEITVNGEKMTVFNVISFLEWITTFDLKWTTVSFINFPEDGILRRALFENVERVSKEVVLFQIHDENITISYRALASLCQICSSSPTPCELLHEMINLPPRAKNLKLEMCSADKAVIPRRFLKNLLNSINPTTLKVYFNSSTEILQMSEYCGDIFSLHDNPITHVSNGNLKFYNAYLNCLEDCCMMMFKKEVENAPTASGIDSSSDLSVPENKQRITILHTRAHIPADS